MKKWFQPMGWIFVLFGVLPAGLKAQAQVQVNVKTGVEAWTLEDEKDLPSHPRYTGQMIGFDVFVEKRRLLFVPGFHYHRISVTSDEEHPFVYAFSDRNHIHYFAIPVAFGWKMVDKRFFDLSLMAGAEGIFYYNLDPGNRMGLDDDELNGVVAGLTGVLHIEWLSIFTTEVKYHHALHPSIRKREDSMLRGWTLAAGIKF